MSAPHNEHGLYVYGPGDFLCVGCGYPEDLCICRDDWDDVEEDRESGYPETQGGFYEDS